MDIDWLSLQQTLIGLRNLCPARASSSCDSHRCFWACTNHRGHRP